MCMNLLTVIILVSLQQFVAGFTGSVKLNGIPKTIYDKVLKQIESTSCDFHITKVNTPFRFDNKQQLFPGTCPREITLTSHSVHEISVPSEAIAKFNIVSLFGKFKLICYSLQWPFVQLNVSNAVTYTVANKINVKVMNIQLSNNEHLHNRHCGVTTKKFNVNKAAATVNCVSDSKSRCDCYRKKALFGKTALKCAENGGKTFTSLTPQEYVTITRLSSFGQCGPMEHAPPGLKGTAPGKPGVGPGHWVPGKLQLLLESGKNIIPIPLEEMGVHVDVEAGTANAKKLVGGSAGVRPKVTTKPAGAKPAVKYNI